MRMPVLLIVEETYNEKRTPLEIKGVRFFNYSIDSLIQSASFSFNVLNPSSSFSSTRA